MLNLEFFLSSFAILFVIIDPPGCASIFAALTAGTSRKHQRNMAMKSIFVAALILFAFALGGKAVFEKLGISLDALRIAGGIMLFIIGLAMVFEKRTEQRDNRADTLLEETEDPEDISVFPMGIPMIAGPGTMASLLLLMSNSSTLWDKSTVLLALTCVLLVSLITFLIAAPLMRLMGKSFTDILTRVLGVLLASLAAQFILDGINGAIISQFL